MSNISGGIRRKTFSVPNLVYGTKRRKLKRGQNPKRKIFIFLFFIKAISIVMAEKRKAIAKEVS
jgi:hypothetical protein